MKKSLKEKIKYNFKEMWRDETEEEAENKPGFRTLLLETPLNFIRFELLYPKMEECYDGTYTKGAFHALPVNMAIGSYIGSQMNGAEGSALGFGVGAFVTIAQMALGTGVKSISDHFIEKYNRKRDLKYHARDYNF
jgi:hypothetical protein